MQSRWVDYGPPKTPFELNKESGQIKGLVGLWPMFPSWGGGIIKNLVSGLGSSNGVVGSSATWSNFSTGRAITINANDDINFGPNVWVVGGNFTFSFWLNFPSTPSGNVDWVKRSTGSNGGWRIRFQVASSRMQVTHFTASPSLLLSFNYMLYDGNTHLYTLQYNAITSTMSFYRDGQFFSSGSLGPVVAGTSQDFTVDTPAGFSYHIFEIRLYNRMLTPIEILGLHNPQTQWELYNALYQSTLTLSPATPTTDTIDLTLFDRDLILTLPVRSKELALPARDLTLTLPERE